MPQNLQAQEGRICQMVYDPVNPIDEFITTVDELGHYVDAANSLYTQP